MATDNVADAWIELHADDALLYPEVAAAAARASRQSKIRLDVEIDRNQITRALASVTSGAGNVVTSVARMTAGLATGALALGTLASVSAGTVASLGGLASGIVAVTGAVVAATPAVVALGGSLAALGLGIGAVVVGSQGMGDALKASAAAEAELAATGEVSAATQEKLAAAMENLSPAAREMARTLGSLREPLENLRRSVQERLFVDIADDVRSIANTLLPEFRRSLGLAADDVNQLVQRFDDFVTAEENIDRINRVMLSLNLVFDHLTDSLVPFGNVLLNTFDAARPLAERFSRAIENTAVSMSGFFEAANESGELTEFFNTAGDLAATLGSILFNLGDALGSIFGAGLDEGQGLLEMFDAATERFAAFLETAEGQGALDSFFGLMGALADQAARLADIFGPVFSGIADAVEAVAPAFLALSQAMTPVLVLLSETVGGAIADLGPVIAGLVEAITPLATEVGGVLVDVFSGLAPVITQVAKAFVPLVAVLGGAIAEALATLAPLFVQLIESLSPLITVVGGALVQIFAALLPVFVNLFAAISPLITAIATGLAPVITALVNAFLPLLPTLVQFVQIIVDALIPAMPALTVALVAVAEVLGVVLEALAPLLPDIAELIAMTIEFAAPLLLIIAQLAEFAIQSGLLQGVLFLVVGAMRIVINIFTAGMEAFGGFVSGIQQGVTDVIGFFEGLLNFFRGLPDRIGGFLDRIPEIFTGIWGDVITDVAVFIGDILNFFLELPGRILGYLAGLADDIADAITPDNIDITPGFDIPGVPGLAAGGVLTRPTIALAGEAGPEAYVPLTPGAEWAPGLEAVVAAALAARGGGQAAGDFIYSPQFYGPSTSGDRLTELEWTMRYATERLPENVRAEA